MKCWMNHLSGEDRYLHKAALKLVSDKRTCDLRVVGLYPVPQARELQEITKSNPLVGFTLISQLVGKNGSQNFDKLTKTKTVEGIMANLDAAGVSAFSTYLRNIASGKDQGPEYVYVLLSSVYLLLTAFSQTGCCKDNCLPCLGI